MNLNKIVFHKTFRDMEMMCYFYDANKTEENKNKILMYILDDISIDDPEILKVINFVLEQDEGGYKLMKMLYKYFGIDLDEWNVYLDDIDDE
jgi:hypothetical protein